MINRLPPAFVALRPQQWVKNLLIFAGLIFGNKLLDWPFVEDTLIAFASFCAASSATYLFNDLRDLEADRHHPAKKNRPLASGRLQPGTAVAMMIVLATGAIVGGLAVHPITGGIIVGYLTMQLFYTTVLKRLVILDVMTIAMGFIFRVLAGTTAAQVPVSPWILANTFLLALFLGFGKRRHERESLGDAAASHRSILSEYGLAFLDQMIAVVASATVVVYMLYTVSDPVSTGQHGPHSPYMIATTPFVLYGIFRYFYLVHQRAGGGSPTKELLTDRPLLATVALWVITVVLLLYVF